MILEPLSVALVVAIIVAEILLPLALAFWGGRRWERRRIERDVSAQAERWLEARTASLEIPATASKAALEGHRAARAATSDLRVLEGGRTRRRRWLGR